WVISALNSPNDLNFSIISGKSSSTNVSVRLDKTVWSDNNSVRAARMSPFDLDFIKNNRERQKNKFTKKNTIHKSQTQLIKILVGIIALFDSKKMKKTNTN